MLSKLFWKISATMFIGFGILLTGCDKDDPSSAEVNAVIAERLDLTEEQAARVQPLTAKIWAEREIFRKVRFNLYDQILVQLKNESVDQEELQNMLYSSWNQLEPMIPKAVNAFSEYHAVLSEEKKMSFPRNWKIGEKGSPKAGGGVGDFRMKSLPPKRSTGKLPIDLI